jgi:transitional endoplasmic reticulum ATPase
MPKKKKKSRSSTDDASTASNSGGNRATPSPKKKSKDIPSSTSKPLVKSDVISVKLLKGYSSLPSSSAVKRSLKYAPAVFLHEADANILDVVVGDRVFVISAVGSLISSTNSNEINTNSPHGVKFMAVARIKIINDGSADRSSTPRGASGGISNSHKKNKLIAGNCNLFPPSLTESFLCSDGSQEYEPTTTPRSSKKTMSTPDILTTPPPKSSSSASMTPIPSSKSKFSFAKGGGGDQLISPTAPTTPSSPFSSSAKPDKIKTLLYIVPFDSYFGDTLASLFCRTAKTLSIRRQTIPLEVRLQQAQPQSSSSSGLSSWTIGGNLRQRLVVASTAGEYIAIASLFSVSMQGQTVKCQVERATHDDNNNDDDDDDINENDSNSIIISNQNKNDKDNSLVADLERLSIRHTDTTSTTSNTIVTSDTVNDLEIYLKSTLSSMNDIQRQKLMLYQVSHNTKIVFVEEYGIDDLKKTALAKDELILSQYIQPKQMVAGLDETIEQLQSALETPLLHPKLFHRSNSSLRPPKGILLHGPSGIGKSSLALQVGSTFESNGSYHVKRIHCTRLQSQTSFVGQAEHRLVEVFTDAQKPRQGKKGCLLILDDIHLICPRREGMDLGMDRLASTLLALLDGMKSGTATNTRDSQSSASNRFYPTVILGVTTNPGSLDPALRRPGRLDAEIEVPLPDEPSTRLEILRFQLELLGAETNFSDLEWLSLARLAKGFTGADLKLAAKEALRNTLLLSGGERKMTLPIIEKAIRSTKPSAIKAVTVEVPRVPWSAIGGMEDVKGQLRDAIELPLNHSETFQRLGIRPPRGVLLYGPPGCSKTLMARALATEGHMNFLAVKGPELLSKWLGESERTLAALFRRARLASPSVIFFDEVDAIASKRGGNSSGGGERLLSQLLTELDGIQQSKDGSGREGRVVIVCATNRPDLLDSALMRPGRIDRMIYVGVPDENSREKILGLGVRKSCADDIDVSGTHK